MVTTENALKYLGIDYTDDVTTYNVERALATARQLVWGGVGKVEGTPLANDPRVDELILIYLEDLYSNRGISAKESGALRRKVHDMEQQLRLELRTAEVVTE